MSNTHVKYNADSRDNQQKIAAFPLSPAGKSGQKVTVMKVKDYVYAMVCCP